MKTSKFWDKMSHFPWLLEYMLKNCLRRSKDAKTVELADWLANHLPERFALIETHQLTAHVRRTKQVEDDYNYRTRTHAYTSNVAWVVMWHQADEKPCFRATDIYGETVGEALDKFAQGNPKRIIDCLVKFTTATRYRHKGLRNRHASAEETETYDTVLIYEVQ